jgi:hypothetical protein
MLPTKKRTRKDQYRADVCCEAFCFVFKARVVCDMSETKRFARMEHCQE